MTNLDFTYEEAEKLIHTPKFILESDGTECTSKAMNFVTGFSETVILMSEDGKVYFKWSIRQSQKEIIKLSLNVIDKDS